VLAIGFSLFFRYTTLGIAIRATADSREVSRLLGINANAVAGSRGPWDRCWRASPAC